MTGDTLIIELSGLADGRVIADAIRLERLGDAVTDSEIQVLSGSSNVADNTGLVEVGATHTFTVRNNGTQDLIVQPVTFTGDGVVVTSNFSVDQLIAPGAMVDFTISLTSPVAFGRLSFENSDGNEDPFDFDVQAAPMTQIIDDGDVGFSTIGGWAKASGGYQTDTLYTNGGSGKIARWEFANLIPGTYEVAATWRVTTVNTTTAPYSVWDAVDGTTLGTASIDQSQAPDDFSAEGRQWEILGVFEVTANGLVIELSNNTTGRLFADAIRIEPVGSLPPIETPIAIEFWSPETEEPEWIV